MGINKFRNLPITIKCKSDKFDLRTVQVPKFGTNDRKSAKFGWIQCYICNGLVRKSEIHFEL